MLIFIADISFGLTSLTLLFLLSSNNHSIKNRYYRRNIADNIVFVRQRFFRTVTREFRPNIGDNIENIGNIAILAIFSILSPERVE